MAEVDFYVYVLYVWHGIRTARNDLGDQHTLRLQLTSYKLLLYNLDEMANEALYVAVSRIFDLIEKTEQLKVWCGVRVWCLLRWGMLMNVQEIYYYSPYPIGQILFQELGYFECL